MAIVRQVELSDVTGVSELTESAGWGPTTLASWNRLWSDNPATATGSFAKGWVLEDAGRIVGYVCNVARLYRFGGATLRAASAGGLVVLPEFRGLSLQLLLQYAKQSSVDLLLNTTAATHVSKISEFLKYERIPQPEYDVSLYWVLESREFLTAALRKRHNRPHLDRWAGAVLSPLAELYVRRRHRIRHVLPPPDVTISVIEPSQIGQAFDLLWDRSAAGADRLLAIRTSEALRWHFARRSDTEWPFVVTASVGPRLAGYVAVVKQDAPHLGLMRARFGDVFVPGEEDARLLPALLAAAIREATLRGASMIELIGFPQSVRAVARTLNPFELRSESWPFFYRVTDSVLHARLAQESVWYASLYDGDGSL